MLLSNASLAEDKVDEFYVLDPYGHVRVMPATLSKIGLLDIETIKSVMRSYSEIDHHCESLTRLGGRFVPSQRRIVQMLQGSGKSVADLNRKISDNCDGRY
jgi:hypothetical protein